jgi:hypothetical protein
VSVVSFARLAYYSAVLAGWGAFIAWIVAEKAVLGRLSDGLLSYEVAITAAVVGAAIGCAVNIASGLSGASTAQLVQKGLLGLVGGGLGGALGGALGDAAYASGLPRSLGWMLMGVGIGVAEGVQEKSLNKIRNGLIGGVVGGLVGGLLFDPIQSVVTSGSGMSSRATAFVVLGLAVGAGVGLAQVVLKDAWLTVLDGYRPGRQLILSRPTLVLGRAEHLPLAFIGPMNADLALEHICITRQPGGEFVVDDVAGGNKATLNRAAITGSTKLHDGDVIKLGANLIRFNERAARVDEQASTGTVPTTPLTPPAPSPPPPPIIPQRGGAGMKAPRQVSLQPPRTDVSPPAGSQGVSPQRAPANNPRKLPPPPPPPPPKR